MEPTILYSFVPDTGEFVGSFVADLDPEDGTPLVPYGSTEVAPPKPKATKARVYRDGQWGFVPDYRGATWYDESGRHVTVDQIGDPSTFDPPLVASKAPTEATKVTSCTPAQGLMALYQTGHYDAYNEAITASSYVPLRIYATSATSWEINNPYIQALQAELGLSDDEVQALFDLAITL